MKLECTFSMQYGALQNSLQQKFASCKGHGLCYPMFLLDAFEALMLRVLEY